MHQAPENAGALFQVASQFNLLEMVSPTVTSEDGVTRYQHDRTQGPACAIAAGAATICRNYFAPVRGGHGQTAECQLDGLADLGAALSAALHRPVEALWKMQNGYALCTQAGLDAITEYLRVRLQKTVYLLDRLGLNSSFGYEYHHYGPYSRDLDNATADAKAFGMIEENYERRQSDGAMYSIFRLSPSAAQKEEAYGELGRERNAPLG
jgi:hypothetical protein